MKNPMAKLFKKVNGLFLITVVIPTLIAIIYYGLVASDIYISESRFVVRSPERQATSGLGMILKGAGFSRSQDDSYTVHDFVLSRDALHQLENKLQVQNRFENANIDMFSRFGLFDASFEALFKYYTKRVSLQTDSASSISTLEVKAYTAEDAYLINQKLLEMSEVLVNNINNNGRRDMIRFAEAEVVKAERKATEASSALSSYRKNNNVFNPDGQSAIILQQISKLQDQLITAKTQLAQVQSLTPDNPQITPLQMRVQSLQDEIVKQSALITSGNASLSVKSASFERLTLEREFADKQLAGAMASLEQARNDAVRKQVYLEKIVLPNKPDVALEPRRLRGVVSILLLSLILWGVLSILLAGVREHKN